MNGQDVHKFPTSTGGLQCAPLANPIAPERLGSARVEPSGPAEAGTWHTFEVTYTAGVYGIDDSGALRVCFRFAADHTKPQLTDPAAPGYTVVEASNNAILECRFEQKGNVRPFDQTLYVKVVNGYLKEGDTISVTFGERSGGSPGMRVQTFVEDTFEFHVLVDPVATFTFQSLPVQPEIAVVPGPPVRYLLVAPSLRLAGQPFSLGLKAEDQWGNPTDQCDTVLKLRSSVPITNLPREVMLKPGMKGVKLDGLVTARTGLVEIVVCDKQNRLKAGQRIQIVDHADQLPFWADFHGQTEETIGTNSARSYFEFARDLAFLDIAAHQGNDFQITNAFWRSLNELTAEMNNAGQFVTLPGYEWSGNTILGGDRNVFFTRENRPIRRSSHALLADRSDIDTDATTAGELFDDLAAAGEDAICFAHCGGRYADINVAHDGRFETAVEVHSAWGTFEWLLHDALKLGHRVGVVCNSDGHKGRPGASYPGASSFGAIGGLTCMLIPELSRSAVAAGLRKRHHYGTTGGPSGRIHLEVQANVPARLYDADPKLGPYEITNVTELMMGDIAQTDARTAAISVSVSASTGVERIDLFNGLDLIISARNYTAENLGDRFRIVMQGAGYRGRFRQVCWDGEVRLRGAVIEDACGINLFNPDRELSRNSLDAVAWRLITTGNFGGVDLWLNSADTAQMDISTPLVEAKLDLAEMGLEERIWDIEGGLDRRLRVFRLPDGHLSPTFTINHSIELADDCDNAVYARVTLEDGTQAWSSPIYLFR